MFRTLLAFLMLIAFFPGTAPGQMKDGVKLVEAEILSNTSAVDGSAPVTAAIRLRMAPGWHTYWLNSGDSGLPTSIDWDLPEGWTAGPIRWPLPKLYVEPGDMQTFGYSGEVTLLIDLTPPAEVPEADKEFTFKAKVSWLVCETMCIPGSAELELNLPRGPTTAQNTVFFQRAEARLPKAGAPPYTLRWEPKDTEVFLKIEGLPEGAKPEFFPAIYLQKHPVSTAPGTIRIPYPPAPEPALISGLLTVTDPASGERSGWYIEHQGGGNVAIPAGGAAATASTAGGNFSLPGALFFGFLGGFILNLMPCVLPVIALKIFGFIGQVGQSRAKIFRMGMAFTAGIFAWFLLTATVVAVFKLLGKDIAWAFQFQNPTFVYSMMVLVFVFSLNLLGVFEIWIPGTGKLVNLSGKEGYGGAFLHGAFATLLATPCTGPILAPVLPVAFTQSIPVTYAMFTAIAAGMALPYVLLTAQPAWMAFLPKPGDWMVRLKQVMGFLLLGTVVWLLGVYHAQGGDDAGISAAWILLGIGTMCWIFGTWITPISTIRQRLGALVAMGAVFYVAHFFSLPSPLADWEEWSPERVAQLQAEGKPVFVDFTADWCTNCKFNERFVLAAKPVERALADFVTLKADWTNGDPEITTALKEHGRSGVPVYLVYPEGGGKPEILPEILNEGVVIDALKRARK